MRRAGGGWRRRVKIECDVKCCDDCLSASFFLHDMPLAWVASNMLPI